MIALILLWGLEEGLFYILLMALSVAIKKHIKNNIINQELLSPFKV